MSGAVFDATDGLSSNVYMANTMNFKGAKQTQTENILVNVSFSLYTATEECPEATELRSDMLLALKDFSYVFRETFTICHNEKLFSKLLFL